LILHCPKIIALTSGRPLGCTFLDWSLHWLAGHEYHWNFSQQCWAPIPQNPIKNQNAHAHHKNHPAGCQQLETMLSNRAPYDRANFATIYYNFQDLPHWLKILGISRQNLSRSSWHAIQRCQLQELQNMAQICCDHGVSQIAVTENPGMDLYFLHARVTSAWMPQQLEPDVSEYCTWFGVDPDLTRWDLREQIALDIRPFEPTHLRDYVPIHCNNYQLTAMDLWIDGSNTVNLLMESLGIEIDRSRWAHWQAVYRQWQEIQMPFVRFAWQASGIVAAIVNNQQRRLPRLTLLQEATIQHCLIYLHDMNLQNWQLEHFPEHTQDLHQLLCANQHSVDLDYRDLLRRSIDSLALINVIGRAQARI
jgi:hypothetical protein